MVQQGTPEQYFGYVQPVATPQPMRARVTGSPTATLVEPVVTYPQLQTTDNTLLVVCFFGTICFLAFLVWMWKK